MIGWLHGFLGAPAQWDALDLPGPRPWMPGHGPHARPRPGATFDAVVDELAAELRDVDVLVGYSMGARFALSLAVRRPGLFRTVVLVGGTPGIEDPRARAERAATDDGLAADLLRFGLDAFVERWEAQDLFATQRDLSQAVLDAQRHRRGAHRADAVAWALATLGTGRMPPCWDALAESPLHVHAVTGDRDAKFTAIAEEMVRRGRGSVTHHRVPGAGHNVVLEDPDAVARIVRGLPVG